MKGHTGPCDAARGGESLCVGCRALEPVTADTITDEQIRELLEELHQAGHSGSNSTMGAARIRMCEVALGIREHVVVDRSEARARCAEILNARGAK